MKPKRKIIIHKFLFVAFALAQMFAASSALADCAIPQGVTKQKDYLVGNILLPTGMGSASPVTLHVKDVTYSNNKCAGQVYQEIAAMWIDMYKQFIAKGVTKKNIEILANSISGVKNSGIYIEPKVNACGYNGFSRFVICSAGTDDWTKAAMAHENMHGWEFYKFSKDEMMQFYLVFAKFANEVYHLNKTNPSKLYGYFNQRPWGMNYLTYGLQDVAEWGSEAFADFVFDGVARGIWPFISSNKLEYKKYFECLWKTDAAPSLCAASLGATVQFAVNDPIKNPPAVEGFTKEQSQSIWRVCFDRYRHTAKDYDRKFVDDLVKKVAPNLPNNPSRHYELAYGDFDHDGIFDWACWYTGPGPNGEKYLWNKNNKQGAYSFVASGKDNSYGEYRPDPFLTLSSMNGGALAQPLFREWQGKYGSANGAKTFSVHQDEWYRAFAVNL